MAQNIEIVKVMLVRDVGNAYRAKQIKKPGTAASVVKEFLAGEDREVFLTMNLDSSNRINSINIVAIGTLDATMVHPREVFKTAILSNARAIIVAHNHPSGNATPSEDDIRMTRQLLECGKLLGIKILDHIIIGDDEYASVDLVGNEIFFLTKKFEENQMDGIEGKTAVRESRALRTSRR